MSTFLIVFVSVYTGMHAFVIYKARVLIPERSLTQLGVMLLVVAMILAPIAARLLERKGYFLPAQMIAHVGYPWMGFIFIAFWAFLSLSAVDLLSRLMQSLGIINTPSFGSKTAVVTVLATAILIFCYGLFEARWIRVERFTVSTSKLPQGLKALKIAQISDVHLGLVSQDGRLKNIFDRIRAESPDILVCTGDLVDGYIDAREEIYRMIREVKPRYGKYAVTGNHEVYAGLSRSLEVMKSLGFEVLQGEARTAGGIINIAGVDDPATGRQNRESALLASVRQDLFTLFLKHRPQVLEESQGLFDLQLSGHTHRGQVFPFRFFTGLVYPMQNGHYSLRNGSRLYTSRGSGTWGPPIRVLSPPEVTIVEILRAENNPPGATTPGSSHK